MSSIYELIGRFYVGFFLRRYGKEIRVAAVVGVSVAAIAAAGAFAATREDDDDV
jgi:hypothetical protein